MIINFAFENLHVTSEYNRLVLGKVQDNWNMKSNETDIIVYNAEVLPVAAPQYLNWGTLAGALLTVFRRHSCESLLKLSQILLYASS